MPIRLSETEIRARMVELRNLRRLHKADRATIDKLRKENKALKARVAELEEIVETQAIQIAELQAYVFGKKRKSAVPTFTKSKPLPPLASAMTRVPRSADSYRRPLPLDSEITSTRHHALGELCSCGGHFRSVTTRTYYEEDVPLPELTPNYRPKLVTRHVVEYGRCSLCGKRRSAAPAELNVTTPTHLGQNIRLWVSHVCSVLGLSYSQISQLALLQFNLKLSDGEISNILEAQHLSWLPAYEQIKAGIAGSPAHHYDETPWTIQSEKMGHAWVMSDSKSANTVYELAIGRGKKHIKKLHEGSSSSSVYITDGYSAYKNLGGVHQLCWAHLYRAIRDLATNSNLPEDKQDWVRSWYMKFLKIYEDLRAELNKPYDQAARQRVVTRLWRRVERLATSTHKNVKDPDKLRRLKQQLLDAGEAKLFACLIYNTPCDNNRAERDLRQLVLKRKRSFGSKTTKGARALSTVLSICTTMWRKHQDKSNGYFVALAGV